LEGKTGPFLGRGGGEGNELLGTFTGEGGGNFVFSGLPRKNHKREERPRLAPCPERRKKRGGGEKGTIIFAKTAGRSHKWRWRET